MSYTIGVCTVKKTPDDGQRNCPKHVEFYFKNKYYQIYFWDKTLHVSDSLVTACEQDQDGTRPDPARKLYDI